MRFVRAIYLCAGLLGLSLFVLLSPNLSAAPLTDTVITLRDLPAGFTAMPTEVLEDFFGPSDPAQREAPVAEFVFLDLGKGYFLGGVSIESLSAEDILVVDLFLGSPETAMQLFASAEDFPFDVSALHVLDAVPIGDLSAAFRVERPVDAMDMSELAPHVYDGPAQLELFLFRHGEELSIAFIIYPPNDPPSFSLEEIAVVWNDRADTPPPPSAQDPLQVLLSLEDLPDGFEGSGEQVTQEATNVGLPVAGVFAFANESNSEGVIGATFDLAAQQEQVLFDLFGGNPRSLLDYASTQSDEPFEVPELEPLGLPPLGDFSSAFSFVSTGEPSAEQPIVVRVDAVIFRHEGVGAALVVFYLDETLPSVALGALAGRWDRRIGAALSSQDTESPTPTPPPTPIPLSQAVVLVRTLNLRDGPGINYASLGYVEQGDTVDVVGQYNDCAWLQVVTQDGEEAWLSGAAQYVVFEEECSNVPLGDIRPATGQLRRFPGSTGMGELVVDNGSDRDSAVILTTFAGEPLLSAYVRAGDSYLLSGIRNGEHWLYVVQGRGWDDVDKMFTRNVSLGRFDESFPFDSTSEEYTIWEVTLHGVPGGTATTSPVDSADFPAIE